MQMLRHDSPACTAAFDTNADKSNFHVPRQIPIASCAPPVYLPACLPACLPTLSIEFKGAFLLHAHTHGIPVKVSRPRRKACITPLLRLPHVRCELMKDINGSSSPASKLVRAKTIPHATRQYEAQLSERDSIFATSYAYDNDPPSPLVSSEPLPVPGAAAAGVKSGPCHQDQPAMFATDGGLAVAPARSLDNLSLRFGPQIASLPLGRSDLLAIKSSARPAVDRSGMTARRVQEDVQDQQPTHADSTPGHETQQSPPTSSATSDSGSRPSTPLNLEAARQHFDHIHDSAERQSYRSWRQGKGKMKGKTIAESQRLVKDTADQAQEDEEQEDVDRKIDAKMPKAEQGPNVRSRKTSHYLGLFKENEQEAKRPEEKSKDKHAALASIREGRDDSVVGTFFRRCCCSACHVSLMAMCYAV